MYYLPKSSDGLVGKTEGDQEFLCSFLINLMMLIITPLESLPLVRGKEIKVINIVEMITP